MLLSEIMADTLLPILNSTVYRIPELAYCQAVASAIAEGRIPELPKPADSLIYGPLVDSSHLCELESCRKTAEEVGINSTQLLRCGGGCAQWIQYCCPEHQREDWRSHKKLCKARMG